MKFLKFFNFKRKKIGAILIEFAFAIPILSGALFFMTDAPRYYYIKSKMRSSVHFAANMIQNISQFKKNKKLTCADLSNIFCASFINQYSGVQLYAMGGNVYPLGHSFSAYVYYVECYDTNKARVVWAWHNQNVAESPAQCTSEFLSANHGNSMVRYVSEQSSPEAIYKNGEDKLTMVKGDAKIIIELSLIPKSVSKKEAAQKSFGFIMMPIRPSVGESYFSTVTIITPKPGLFDEIPPAS